MGILITRNYICEQCKKKERTMLNLIRRLWYMRHPTVTVYKIVRQSAYKSVIIDGKAQVEYEVGKWAIAPWWLSRRRYDLLCFDDLLLANSFRDLYGESFHFQIWRASAKGITIDLPSVCWLDNLGMGEILEDSYNNWPSGTVMAKAVRLEERVA